MMWTRVKPEGAGSLGLAGAGESGFGVSALAAVVDVVTVVAVVEPVSVDEAPAGATDVDVPSTTGVAESAGGVDDAVSAGVVEAVLASVDVP
jgi:hypothetical protein